MASERRLHPLSFIFAIQDSAKQFLFPAVAALFAARSSGAWEIWASLAIVPIAATAFARAWSVRYRFDDAELVVRNGFFFKRVRHIPYDRVQNVDAVKNPLHRLLGVIEVRIETGGGAETEAVLRVVNASALEEIRAAVFTRRAAAASAEVAEAPGAIVPRVLMTMSARDVALFGLIQGYGMIVAGAFFGLLYEFGLFDRAAGAFFEESGAGRGVLRQLARAVFDDGPLPVRQLSLTLVALIVSLLVFRVLSALWMAVTYWGFRLTRTGDDLRCEYGLLTRVASTIPVRRIQKLTLREGPWHRLTDRVSLQVQTAGGKAGTDGKSTRTWLAPLVHRDAVFQLIASILPEVATAVEWQPVHPRGVRREFAGMMFVVVPLFAASAWTFGWGAFAVLPVLLLWSLLYSRRTVGALRWGVSEDAVHFASGWIWRSRLAAPLTKVQVVSRHETPFDRRHGMASVAVDTAGQQMAGYSIHVPYLAAPVAVALSERLSAAAARAPFRW